jgi:alpha-L-fucosidase 2
LLYGALSNGKGGNGMQYAARLKAVAKEGTVLYTDSLITIKGAGEVTLILTAATSYRQRYPDFTGEDPQRLTSDQLRKAGAKPYALLLKRHVDDYATLFGKVSLNVCSSRWLAMPAALGPLQIYT